MAPSSCHRGQSDHMVCPSGRNGWSAISRSAARIGLLAPPFCWITSGIALVETCTPSRRTKPADAVESTSMRGTHKHRAMIKTTNRPKRNPKRMPKQGNLACLVTVYSRKIRPTRKESSRLSTPSIEEQNRGASGVGTQKGQFSRQGREGVANRGAVSG